MAHPLGVRPIALAILASVMLAAGERTSSAEWRRIDSPNFVVIGDVSARTLRDVAVKFEGFRETLARVFTERATATAVPTVVYVFPSDRAFTPFKKVYNGKPVPMSGLFVRRQDANYIAIVAGRDTEGLRIVFHEYAHLVVSNVMRNVPAWLDEGLAELYSTYEVRDGGREALLGAPMVHHLQELNDTRLLTLDELLNVDHGSPLYNEGSRRSVFYAQSWALTHMILLGHRRPSELFAYLDRVSRGVAPKEAWQQAFGAGDMERELTDYVRRRSYSAVQYKFPEKLATFEAVAAPLPDADAEAFLSEFLLQQGRPDEARERLSAAAKLDPDNLRVKTVAALLDISRDDFEKAGNRLLGVGAPADWLIAYGAAVGFVELVENRRGTPDAKQMDSARRLFAIVREQGREIPNAAARLATLELLSPEGPSNATRTAIERARMLASGREDYAFVHAQILARLEDFTAARQVIGPFMSVAYPPDVRQAARSLMSYIVELETAAQSRATRNALLAAASQPGAESTGPEASAPAGSNTSPPRVAPVFRTLQDGEQRIDAVLERIECSAKGDVVFHVLTVAGPARIGPQPMAKVDFITYRDDLAGSVRCGPLKPPLPVMVSWRAGAAPNAKIAVALEFPPK